MSPKVKSETKDNKNLDYMQTLIDKCSVDEKSRLLNISFIDLWKDLWLLKTDFILNEDRYQNATILITRKNFGCGSSREHAAWAISDYGFKAIIAESFADIFYNNCFKNGLLPIALSESQVQSLFEIVTKKPDYRLTVNLEKQVIIEPSENRISFEINAYRKKSLMAGLDEIGETLEYAEDIISFESRHKAENPWLFQEIKV